VISATRLWYWSSQLHHRRGWVVLPKLIKAVNFVLFKSLPAYQAELGQGVVLEHHGMGVVIHPNVVLGDRVKIWHGVTVAAETPPGSPVRVRIGDDVVLGAGCCVVGRHGRDLVIGDGATVGAGAVVTGDVAAGAVVVGVPARAVRRG
jgi:serine O-acetyltransferase